MGLRFHRSLRIFPGVHLNFSKTGVSLSIGEAPFTINLGRGREKITGSLPGSGLSYSKELDEAPREERDRFGPWRWLRSLLG